MRKLIIFIFLLTILSFNVFPLALSKADFGQVTPGERIVKKMAVGSDAIDNTYVLEASGEPADWVTIIPDELFVPAKFTEEFTVIVNVPNDIGSGYYEGFILATGKEIIGGSEGTGVGIQLQIKSILKLEVVNSSYVKPVPKKEELFEAASIIDLYVKPDVIRVGETARVFVTIINAGNTPTSPALKVEISKDGKIVDTLTAPGTTLDIAKDHTQQLFWVTDGLESGIYEITAYSTSGKKPISWGPIQVEIIAEEPREEYVDIRPNPEEISQDSSIFLDVFLAIVILAIIAFIIFEIIKRKRK